MWVLFCARERTALAEGPQDEAPPRHVEIKMVARQEDRALVAVLSELLDRLQGTTTYAPVPDLETEEMWTPHPNSPGAVARAWIDLREPKVVTLYLTGDGQDRVLIRQVPLPTNLDEVAREETTSRVLLGRLLLDRGADPTQALGLFTRYLDESPGGTLAEEARLGRALALTRLGSAKEERQAWQQLLAFHPNSIHAERARKRLEELH